MQANEPPPGLRERKRRATRRAIQDALLNLASDHGYDRITIEEVSEKAGISPRTFFNYFSSKEAAAIGNTPTLAGLEAVQVFLAEGPEEDLLEGLARLFRAAFTASAEDRASNQSRRVLLRDNPPLFAKRMSVLHEFEEELADLVIKRLATDNVDHSLNDEDLVKRAKMVSIIGYATLRYAYSGWVEGDDDVPLAVPVQQAFKELTATVALTRLD